MKDLLCFSYLQVNWSELLSQANYKLWKVHASFVMNCSRESQMTDVSTVGEIV